jgi:hypothetical protein
MDYASYALLEGGSERRRRTPVAEGLSVLAIVIAAVALTFGGVAYHQSNIAVAGSAVATTTATAVAAKTDAASYHATLSGMITSLPVCANNWNSCNDLLETVQV